MPAPTATPPSAPVRIGVVVHQLVVRQGLLELIAELGGYEVCFTAHNGQELMLRHQAAEPVALVIVALCMPVMNGVDTTRWICTHWADTRVLVLSMDRSAAAMREALRAGTHGYLPMDFTLLELRDALEGVCQRGCYHHDGLLREHLAAGEAPPGPDRTAGLSCTERMVLDCVCTDDEPSWKQVAARMNKSAATVDTQRAALFRKLHLKSKTGLVSFGRTHDYGQGRYWSASKAS